MLHLQSQGFICVTDLSQKSFKVLKAAALINQETNAGRAGIMMPLRQRPSISSRDLIQTVPSPSGRQASTGVTSPNSTVKAKLWKGQQEQGHWLYQSWRKKVGTFPKNRYKIGCGCWTCSPNPQAERNLTLTVTITLPSHSTNADKVENSGPPWRAHVFTLSTLSHLWYAS